MKPAKGFAQHIILYAKGWYGRSGNILQDIAELLKVYAGLSEPSIRDAKEVLCSAFAEYGRDNYYDMFEAVYEITGWKWESFPPVKRTPEQVMIGKLSIIDGEYVDTSEKLNVDFSKSPHHISD